MDCDGPKHVMIHDLDGSFLGLGHDASILARAEYMKREMVSACAAIGGPLAAGRRPAPTAALRRNVALHSAEVPDAGAPVAGEAGPLDPRRACVRIRRRVEALLHVPWVFADRQLQLRPRNEIRRLHLRFQLHVR